MIGNSLITKESSGSSSYIYSSQQSYVCSLEDSLGLVMHLKKQLKLLPKLLYEKLSK